MTNNDRYTDEALTSDLTDTMPGPRRRAALLLEVPFEVRSDIDWETNTMQNYIGGRGSDNMRSAISTWRRTGKFPFQDRARAHREAEKAANEGNIGPRIILPMN